MPFRKPRGLLVEDDIRQLERRSELLRFRNVDVIEATSKVEALDRLRSVRFMVDTAITDLHLQRDLAILEGGEIAEAIADNSGGTVAVFAYSGKASVLEEDLRRYYRKIVLKYESPGATGELIREAAEAANMAFDRRVRRALGLLSDMDREPRVLAPIDVAFLRDMIVGSTPPIDAATPHGDRIGVLTLENGARVPYSLEGLRSVEDTQSRVVASVLGHEYLYGIGTNYKEASDALADVLHAYMSLVPTVGIEAAGPSLRMRTLMIELMRAGEGESETDD